MPYHVVQLLVLYEAITWKMSCKLVLNHLRFPKTHTIYVVDLEEKPYLIISRLS